MTEIIYEGKKVKTMKIVEGEVFMTLVLEFDDGKRTALGAFRQES